MSEQPALVSAAGAVQQLEPGTILTHGLPPGLPVRFYVAPFLSWCAASRDLSPQTIKAYRNALTPFAAFCEGPAGVASPEHVRPRVIEGYMAWRRMQYENGPATIQQHRAALVTFFTFLRLYDVVTVNPVGAVKGPTIPYREPRYADVPEQERLLHGLRERAALGVHEWRDFALIALALLAGLRRSEISNLAVADLKLSSGSLLVRQGKGRKDRPVVVMPWLQDVLQRYLAGVRPQFPIASDYVFLSRIGGRVDPRTIYALVKRATAAALRGDGLNPHALRHSYVARLVESDANLVAVQRQLGHASLATTSRYTHFATSRMVARMAKWLDGKFAATEIPAVPTGRRHRPTRSEQIYAPERLARLRAARTSRKPRA